MSYSQPIGSPGEQLQAIHAMLAAGHRSVHLERHSLLLIGAVGGFLSVVSEWAITPERFPDATERGFALLVWLAFWLGGVSLLDHWLTRRARARRAETLPFAQTQITRAWWMLLSVGCLGSFAMSFYGGGSMIYALWTVLLGLGIYLFGLFSQRLIEWIGLATILLGITGLAAGVSYETTRWLNASCFAVGMPLAGWMAARIPDPTRLQRSLALALWIAVVITPPLVIAPTDYTEDPQGTAVAPQSPAALSGERIVQLHTGTRIPLRVNMRSPILHIDPNAELEMTLAVPLEVVLRDGLPDGRFRVVGGNWRTAGRNDLWLRINRIQPGLEDGQPVIRAHAKLDDEALGHD